MSEGTTEFLEGDEGLEDNLQNMEPDYYDPWDDLEEEGEGGDETAAPLVEESTPPAFDQEFGQRLEAETQRRLDSFYAAQYGQVTNPLTGRPIQSEADFLQYSETMKRVQQEEQLAQAGVDPAVLNGMISNHPAIVAAQRMQEAQAAKETELFVKDQFGFLLAKYPDCGFADATQLGATKEGQAVLRDWAATGDLVKAYTANFADEIIKRKTAAVKQGTLNEVNGKRHLAQPKGSASGGESISPEELKTWRGFFPDASYDEILKLWRENKD